MTLQSVKEFLRTHYESLSFHRKYVLNLERLKKILK